MTSRPTRLSAALAGVTAAAAALATGELLAGLVGGAPSPLVAIGDLVIAYQPPGAKEAMVALFGTADKIALAGIITGAVLVAGAIIGLVRPARPDPTTAAIAVLVGTGILASLRSPATVQFLAAISFFAQFVVGLAVVDLLLGRAPRTADAGAAADPGFSADPGATPDPPAPRRPGPAGTRRGFLSLAGGIGVVSLAGGLLGRTLLDRRAGTVEDVAGRVPGPVDPAPPLPPDPADTIAGLTPFIVPVGQFYRIDTALVTPTVDLASWRLRVHGMVDRELELDFDALLELPVIERHVTIACVSNEVGGGLVGNATWSGVRLTDVLDLAGVRADASQIVGRSVDGFTAGFPTAWVTERERDALVAVTMNGAPLPAAHGFPARLIVPGLYGYVSATKWLSELELTTLEGFDAYWVPLGWAKEAPILTQSRIDVPGRGARLAAGPVAVAGVAWAPDRGISAVEVRIDDGPWRPATIVGEIGPQSWVQWRLTWDATPGRHELRVRATDGTGEVQTDRITRPDPDGARGHHTIAVDVS
jgi:DMSO/TMAO reductase YedYZ molybdopterin-dependent catalytic subunit